MFHLPEQRVDPLVVCAAFGLVFDPVLLLTRCAALQYETERQPPHTRSLVSASSAAQQFEHSVARSGLHFSSPITRSIWVAQADPSPLPCSSCIRALEKLFSFSTGPALFCLQVFFFFFFFFFLHSGGGCCHGPLAAQCPRIIIFKQILCRYSDHTYDRMSGNPTDCS